jgi:hypothetical protein
MPEEMQAFAFAIPLFHAAKKQEQKHYQYFVPLNSIIPQKTDYRNFVDGLTDKKQLTHAGSLCQPFFSLRRQAAKSIFFKNLKERIYHGSKKRDHSGSESKGCRVNRVLQEESFYCRASRLLGLGQLRRKAGRGNTQDPESSRFPLGA